MPASRLRELPPSTEGLTAEEARSRRQRFGGNDIVERRRRRWRDLARQTAGDPMLWFLAATSALYAAVGQRLEAATLLAAIVPLVAMDLVLHRRTQASTEGLRSRLATRATVVRDGAAAAVPATEVVPGDLALVTAGEWFPADGVVVEGDHMQADESSLTGETYAVAKRVWPPLPRDGADLPVEHEGWGLAGTRLLTGRASLRVVFTGADTHYGEIVRSATSGAQARTPLQREIARLVGRLLGVATLACVLLGAVRIRQGYGWIDAAVSAVTLASAAIPEEFPVVFAFFLGVGVYRLAKRQALVRRAVSVENLGRVSCICADKTGTITEGRLRLARAVPGGDVSEQRLLALAALASRPHAGDPLDDALARDGRLAAAGAVPDALARFPFTEDRRRESAVARDADGALVAVTKGAAEAILSIADAADRDAWNERSAALAADGYKVIVCAWRRLAPAEWRGREIDAGFRVAGLLAFEDPVRDGVAAAVTVCRSAGIHTIMVTGDHPLTARAVGRHIGLGAGAPTVVTADEVAARLAGGDGAALRRVDVVARAAPGQKLALVRALQDAGEIVAVTGDGVNDVPALQAADVGIAMGERGTRSAREVAAIVLLDDNFRTIVRAIGEGWQVFRNLRLSFEYLLMIHIPLVVTAALIPLAGYPLLYLPTHLVWLELIIHPTALLVFQEQPPAGPLPAARARRPRGFFSGPEWATIGAVGALVTLAVVALYARGLAGGPVEHARAAALATLTAAGAAITAGLTALRTPISRWACAATLALSVGLIQSPPPAALLHLQPLHLDDWAAAIAAGGLAVLVPLGAAAALGLRRSRAA